MITLGAAASTWMSNAKLLQSELCISNNTHTWFAARVSEYTCLTVGSRRSSGPVFGSSGRSLARRFVETPSPERYRSCNTWFVEDPTLFAFPRQDVTLPRAIDPRRANALISRLMSEISVEPLTPQPEPTEVVPLPAEAFGSESPMFPSIPLGDVAGSGILPRPKVNRADVLGALQPGLTNLLSPRRSGRAVRGKGGMTLTRGGAKGLEQSGGVQLPMGAVTPHEHGGFPVFGPQAEAPEEGSNRPSERAAGTP